MLTAVTAILLRPAAAPLCLLLVWVHLLPFYSRLAATSPACDWTLGYSGLLMGGSPNTFTTFNYPLSSTRRTARQSRSLYYVEDFSKKCKAQQLELDHPRGACMCIFIACLFAQ